MTVAGLLNGWIHGGHVTIGDLAFRSGVCVSSPCAVWSALLKISVPVTIAPFGRSHDKSDTYPLVDTCRLRSPYTAVGFPGVSQVHWTVVL